MSAGQRVVSETAGRRRVVVTGLGVASALGCEVEAFWSRVVAGDSGIGFIRQFDSSRLPVRLGSEVDSGALPDGDDDPAVASNRTLRFGLWAARRAFRSAGLEGVELGSRGGVVIGAGVFPVVEEIAAGGGAELLDGERIACGPYLEIYRRNPHFLSQQNLNEVSSRLSAAFGLRGASLTVQSACASATLAIGEAFNRVRDGRAEVMLTGGTDSMMSAFSVAGFTLLGALTRNGDPATASRPFDAGRDGFVLGEGAGMLVLEELEHARARGASILAEVVGFGGSSDAYRFTDMHPDAVGAARAMRAALDDAGLDPEEVDYINAHGTSTPQNDRMESLAVKHVFGEHAYRLALSSTKSQLGHLLCAAGGVELLVTVLALAEGIVPPTIHLENPDRECDLDYVPRESRRRDLRVAISNSFAFGGQNGSLAVRRWEG